MIVFLAATGLFLGFTHFWLAGTSVLVGLFMWRKWVFTVHWIPLSLGALISIAGIWSHDPLAGILWACNVQMLYGLWRVPESELDKRKVYQWLFILTSILMVLALIEVVYLRDYRPETFLVKDASILGFSGMSTLNPLSGITGTRSAVAGMWVFAMLTMRLKVFGLVAVATCFLFVAPLLDVTDWKRFTLEGVDQAVELREDVSDPVVIVSVPNPDPDPDPVTVDPVTVEVPLRAPWYGFGYHSYVLETGLQRPHNVFVLAGFELGYFAIFYFLLIAWGSTYVPFRIRLMLLPLILITEEWFSRPEGTFLVFALVLSAHYWTPKFNPIGQIHARMIGQRRGIPARH